MSDPRALAACRSGPGGALGGGAWIPHGAWEGLPAESFQALLANMIRLGMPECAWGASKGRIGDLAAAFNLMRGAPHGVRPRDAPLDLALEGRLGPLAPLIGRAIAEEPRAWRSGEATSRMATWLAGSPAFCRELSLAAGPEAFADRAMDFATLAEAGTHWMSLMILGHGLASCPGLAERLAERELSAKEPSGFPLLGLLATLGDLGAMERTLDRLDELGQSSAEILACGWGSDSSRPPAGARAPRSTALGCALQALDRPMAILLSARCPTASAAAVGRQIAARLEALAAAGSAPRRAAADLPSRCIALGEAVEIEMSSGAANAPSRQRSAL